MFLIYYQHDEDERAVSATASNLDGSYKLTVTRDGVERTIGIGELRFRELWKGIAEIPDIATNPVSDPNAPLDFESHHMILVDDMTEGQESMQTFAIPIAGCSPEFLEWLRSIAPPSLR